VLDVVVSCFVVLMCRWTNRWKVTEFFAWLRLRAPRMLSLCNFLSDCNGARSRSRFVRSYQRGIRKWSRTFAR